MHFFLEGLSSVGKTSITHELQKMVERNLDIINMDEFLFDILNKYAEKHCDHADNDQSG